MKTKQKTIKIILSIMVFTSIISCKEKVQDNIQEIKIEEVKEDTIISVKDSLTVPVEEKKSDSELMKDIFKNSK
jgi:hypothetical protein